MPDNITDNEYETAVALRLEAIHFANTGKGKQFLLAACERFQDAAAQPAYGNKRSYPKIDIFVAVGNEWRYAVSTVWACTLREAKTRYLARNHGATVKCRFAS